MSIRVVKKDELGKPMKLRNYFCIWLNLLHYFHYQRSNRIGFKKIAACLVGINEAYIKRHFRLRGTNTPRDNTLRDKWTSRSSVGAERCLETYAVIEMLAADIGLTSFTSKAFCRASFLLAASSCSSSSFNQGKQRHQHGLPGK